MLMLEECKEALRSWQNLAASGTTALQFGHVTLAPKPTNCASYHSSDARQRLYPGNLDDLHGMLFRNSARIGSSI
jgi:hypothetical protein